MNAGKPYPRRAALIAVAALAVFGIGVFAGREIFRAPARPREPSMQYDLTELSGSPPRLPRWRLLRIVPVPLAEPRGLASLPDGTILVCGDRALLALDRGGMVLRRWELEGRPGCVAVGGDGRYFVGVGDHLEVIDPEEKGPPRLWPYLGPQAIITSVAASGPYVFAADAGNRAVLRFDSEGKLTGRIGEDYLIPSPYFDLAAQADGSLWVVDPGRHRLLHFSPAGNRLGFWGVHSSAPEGFLGCCNPAHIALLPCGCLVTSERGLLRVKVYEPDGMLASLVAWPTDFHGTEPSLDLATRKSDGGEILVLFPLERVVRVYVR